MTDTPLREQIAREIKAARERLNDAVLDENVDALADRILAIPQIEQALRQAYGERELQRYLDAMRYPIVLTSMDWEG